jgi:hypothetical protein
MPAARLPDDWYMCVCLQYVKLSSGDAIELPPRLLGNLCNPGVLLLLSLLVLVWQRYFYYYYPCYHLYAGYLQLRT